MLNPSLEVTQIKKTYPKLPTLASISLKLEKNQFVSVLGPSGCGKSTLFSIVAGLVQPDAGSVYMNGIEITGRTGQVSYMHQKDLLLPWKKVLDNAALPLFLKGVKIGEAREKAASYFPLFGLEGFEEYYPNQLSGGMRQRVALLRTFLFSRDILLLDEPFGGLDAMTRQAMQNWLMEVVQALNVSILLITHDVDEAILMSDRIYVFSDRPAVVKGTIDVTIPRPRKSNLFASPAYIETKEHVLACLEKPVGETEARGVEQSGGTVI